MSDSGENPERRSDDGEPSEQPRRLTLRGAPEHMRDSIRRAQNAEVSGTSSLSDSFVTGLPRVSGL